MPGESGVPEHIETVLSNVFLFKERVYKLYKNDNDFVNKNFGDLSIKEKRFEFSNIDFSWNQQLAKEVYLRIQGANVGMDSVRFVDKSEETEELLIVTKRLPREASLFEHLRNNDLVETDYYEIGKQFAEREKGFISNEELSKTSLLENMSERNISIVDWVRGAEKYISHEEIVTYTGQLTNLIKIVYTGDSAPLSIAFDVHSLNAFYIDRAFYPFDVVAVNDAWHFAPALVNIYRLATDVFALVGEKNLEPFYADILIVCT